ncbi:MAG: oxidoreductase [Deltaproteobacteria bacterium RIFCSPHIGHO2_02_FULL_40_11]|nr:MAG: oxidoreductase [Deltaproteobacteria bacterium RIFCSPHIGHO2_02_FULL_40_11]
MNHIAIVGCGFWGPNLIRNFSKIEGIKLTACDIREERLQNIRTSYSSVNTTRDFNEILSCDEIDVVVIATPATRHFEMAKIALENNKHVFVEKPLAITTKEVQELIRIAKERHKILMVGHTFEYNPAVIKLKEYIDHGDVGSVYYIYSSRLNLGQVREDINAMWNLAPHDISILIYLLGETPRRVSAVGKAFIQDKIEDVVFMTLEFASGVIAYVHVSWLSPSKVREMTIVGDKKMIVYDDIDNEAKLKIYDKGISKVEDAYGEYFLKLRSGDIYIPKIDLNEPLKIEITHFIECIRKSISPKTDGENGLRVVKVLEAAQTSLKNQGAFVPIE